MIHTLFLAWQDPVNRSWHPIGKLRGNGRRFVFVYTKGVLEALKTGHFRPLTAFPDVHAIYQSSSLFPVFTNRLMRESRPDFSQYLTWLNLTNEGATPMAVLARSGGQRVTDTLEMFPYPEHLAEGTYETRFFIHGLSHMPPESAKRAEDLGEGERLSVALDTLNRHDAHAIALRIIGRNSAEECLLGYVPRYLNRDIIQLMRGHDNHPEVIVERLNLPPAPSQFRVLCRLRMKWQTGFQPFASEEFQPFFKSRRPALQVA